MRKVIPLKIEVRIMFRTILVPLDGSAFAEQALPWALSIARRSGAMLDLVRGHVLYALKCPAAAWGPYDPEMESECKQEEKLYLDSTAHWLASVSPVPTRTAVVPGLDAEGILERAVAIKADLVVMTTHGRGPLGRLFLGSMANEMIRRSQIPVLLIHARDPAPGLTPEPAPQRVLIPLDGSALAEKALGPACDLARLLEVPCCLLRAIEPVEGSSARAKAAAYLGMTADRLREQGLDVDQHVLSGSNAAAAIVGEANNHDLIALATHGRGGIGRVLLGSVADEVIRSAMCPVLVYRPS
jgi:nucleotide-binding universal stress UspA family protein